MKKVEVILIILACTIVTGCTVKKVEKLTDGEKFAKEYSISKENAFIYCDYKEFINILNNKKALVLLADSDEETSIKAVEIINSVAKENKVEKIYYYNPKLIREKQHKKYKALIKLLKEKNSNKQVTLPTLYAFENGKIVNYCNYFGKKEQLSEEYLNKKRVNIIKNKYLEVINYNKIDENQKEDKQS